MIIMDFTEAFDKVPHQFGTHGETLHWIQGFLSGRSLCVIVLDRDGVKTIEVTSGLPQGTVLSPILFINDLPDNIDSTVRLFADDCMLYREVKAITDCHALQGDLARRLGASMVD
jgi:hypothetical protein